MERDPDVSTRMCSACGYVGKWISEMIRHRRVHTNERPFKYRYCSRTSKWKADLIRHVAKTHGIRVLSKYSRSKAFDHSLMKHTKRDDADKPKVIACKSEEEPERQKQLLPLTIDAGDVGDAEVNRPEPLLQGKIPLSYRCSHCHFEQVSV
uniref:C2H2-type domain-containing protein n=1 Tax=Angiostrongylus cantonensis TaxID=6313 RepID=A0A0K0D726_ANGCA